MQELVLKTKRNRVNAVKNRLKNVQNKLVFILSEIDNKLKVEIYIPLDACACEWDKFLNRIFEVLTPYMKYIKYDTKNLNSIEARNLNLHGNCVLVDGNKKYTASYLLKRDLPNLLKERELI